MAAPTLSEKKWRYDSNKLFVQCLFTPSTTYLTATPSETVSLASLGLKKVDYIYLPSQDLLDYSIPLAAANQKRGFSVTLVAPVVGDTAVNLRFWETNGTEVADATNKSASTFYIVFVGV